MENPFSTIIGNCKRALGSPDPQRRIEMVLREAVNNPAAAQAISKRSEVGNLEDMAIHRSDNLTLLAVAVPPDFYAGPHNHNLWSVVGVCAGREDNQFFERQGKGLRRTAELSVVGPGVLANDADVIHAIRNPLDTPLLALHAYGGDLFATPRSSWDPKTYEEIVFDWEKVAQN